MVTEEKSQWCRHGISEKLTVVTMVTVGWLEVWHCSSYHHGYSRELTVLSPWLRVSPQCTGGLPAYTWTAAPWQRKREEHFNCHPHIHPSHGDPISIPLLLSHGPWRAAAERWQVWLLLLDLQHEHQAGVLVTEEVQQEHQKVVDDVGLIALPACVHVDGQTGIPQSQPLEEDSRDRITFYT